MSYAEPPTPRPAQKSAQLNGPVVKSALADNARPRHALVPNFHQSGRAGVLDVMSTCAERPTNRSTFAGGRYEASSANGSPELESQAKVLSRFPAVPQSSHDRLIPGDEVPATWKKPGLVAVPAGVVTRIGLV